MGTKVTFIQQEQKLMINTLREKLFPVGTIVLSLVILISFSIILLEDNIKDRQILESPHQTEYWRSHS